MYIVALFYFAHSARVLHADTLRDPHLIYEMILAAVPVMDLGPQNLTVLDGKDATLNCRAVGAPTPNVTWIYNGKHLALNLFECCVFAKITHNRMCLVLSRHSLLIRCRYERNRNVRTDTDTGNR